MNYTYRIVDNGAFIQVLHNLGRLKWEPGEREDLVARHILPDFCLESLPNVSARFFDVGDRERCKAHAKGTARRLLVRMYALWDGALVEVGGYKQGGREVRPRIFKLSAIDRSGRPKGGVLK